MPRLTRKNIKVFAGNATNNGVFGSLQANNPTTTADIEQIQSLNAWGEGWNAATETSEELPPLEEIQSVSYVTTYQQAYIMQEGIPEWAATVTYYKGCLTKEVTSTGFKIYNSLTDNNTGNLLSDTSNWKKVMDSDDLYAFDNTVVHKTGNETINGTKTFNNEIYSTTNNVINRTTTQGDASVRMFDWDSTVYTRLRSINNNTSTPKETYLDVIARQDGTTQIDIHADNVFAHTPNTYDISDQIATTAFVKNVLDTLYPVGSIYIGTQNTCPLASLISGSQWQLVAQDRALWGGNGSNANTTIAAGLPNITGHFAAVYRGNATGGTTDGVFRRDSTFDSRVGAGRDTDDWGATYSSNASRSSSVYGQSSTVQPPAYRVNVWRRTA